MTRNNATYRPDSLSDILGQPLVTKYLMLQVNGFKTKGIMPGHSIFLGPSGTGKTTLAQAYAKDLGCTFKKVMAKELKKTEDVVNLLKSLPENTLLFIDEIHRLSPRLQEDFYEPMEDGCMNVNGYRTKLNKFVLVGATTHAGELNDALMTRFSYKAMLVPYSNDYIANMVLARCEKAYGVTLDKFVALKIASVSRRNPRIATELLRGFVDLAEASSPAALKDSDLTLDLLTDFLRYQGIDPLMGFDLMSRQYLVSLMSEHGKSVGFNTLVLKLRTEESTVKTLESFLLADSELAYKGEKIVGPLVELTSGGRIATPMAYRLMERLKQLQDSDGWFPGEKLVVTRY